jgi:hypothetical protein
VTVCLEYMAFLQVCSGKYFSNTIFRLNAYKLQNYRITELQNFFGFVKKKSVARQLPRISLITTNQSRNSTNN